MKIATTTKVMQELMGIDRPTSGMIFARRIHASPARPAPGGLYEPDGGVRVGGAARP